MSRTIMRKQKEYRKRVLELNSGMMSFEAETFFNFEMIKSFGILGHYSKRLKGWQKKYKEYNLEYNMFSIKTHVLMTLVGTLVGMAKARERQAIARMVREAQEQAASQMEGSKDHYMQGEKGWWDL